METDGRKCDSSAAWLLLKQEVGKNKNKITIVFYGFARNNSNNVFFILNSAFLWMLEILTVSYK